MSSSRFYVFDGPGHGRQLDYHGGPLELTGPDGRCQRYKLISFTRGSQQFRLLAPPHTKNRTGLEEFIDEYHVPAAANQLQQAQQGTLS